MRQVHDKCALGGSEPLQIKHTLLIRSMPLISESKKTWLVGAWKKKGRETLGRHVGGYGDSFPFGS
jgi:hypothetical protein